MAKFWEDEDLNSDSIKKHSKKAKYVTSAIVVLVLGVLLLAALYMMTKDKKSDTSVSETTTKKIEVTIESTTKSSSETTKNTEKETTIKNQETMTKQNEQEETTKKVEEETTKIKEQIKEDDAIKEVVIDKEDPESLKHDNNVGEVIKVEDLIIDKKDSSLGIDVSKWQGIIDWIRVKEAGVNYAIIRIGYSGSSTGKIVEDEQAAYNLQKAISSGIKVGVYFFSSAITKEEALNEAKWVADYIAPYKITYPVVFDMENYNNIDNRMYSLTKIDRTNLAITFLDYIKNLGYIPMFYNSKNELINNKEWETDRLEARYKMWVARYPDIDYKVGDKLDYEGDYHIWQYTDKGKINGISGYVDLNASYMGELTKYVQKSTEKVKEINIETMNFNGSQIIFQVVNDEVTAKDSVNLRTEPSTDKKEATIVTLLLNGTKVKRTGIGSNGWSKLLYNGKVVYAVTSLLTTDLEMEKPTSEIETIIVGEISYQVTPISDKVTAKEVVNLRSEPSTINGDNSIVGELVAGNYLDRTATTSNGWSRLIYNGKEVYALSSYLTK